MAKKSGVSRVAAASTRSATRAAAKTLGNSRPHSATKDMTDGLQNLVTGMGTEKDKAFSTTFAFSQMNRVELDAAYRSDWIARKAVDIPVDDATREWREWQADPDEVEAIETIEKDLAIQMKVRTAMQRGRLYGGGGLVLGINDGKQPEEEVVLDDLDEGCLEFVHAVSRYELQAGEMEWDVLSPYYGEPKYYTQSGNASASLRLHPSRVVRFIGNEIPDPALAQGWGDSIIQSVYDAIIGAGSVNASLVQLIAEAKLDVIKIPGLSQNIMNPDYEARLKKRFSFANVSKSIFGILLLDKEEEWERIKAEFAGMPDVQKVFLLVACGAVDIPATRFLGQSPAGLSSTGEGDLRNYYDGVGSKQKNEVQPTLVRLDEVLIRSALGAMPSSGEGDHGDIHYNWRPLWQMTPAEKATVAKTKAETFKVDVDAGLINEVVLKKAREAQLIEDGTYPGLQAIIEDFDDDPDLEQAAIDEEEAARQAAEMLAQGGAPASTNPDASNAQKQIAGPQPKLLASPTKKPPSKGAKKRAPNAAVDAMVRRMQDAVTPRTLYVRRDLINQKAVKAWAKKAGFKTSLTDMHVTIAYSKEPVDWIAMGNDGWSGNEKGTLTVKAGGPRVLEKFGSAIVLAFASSDLSWRWRDMKDRGASWSYDDYTPHVTITYDGGDIDFMSLKAYDGELVFGPEIFEEIKTGFNNEVDTVEDGLHHSPRGQFSGRSTSEFAPDEHDQDEMHRQASGRARRPRKPETEE